MGKRLNGAIASVIMAECRLGLRRVRGVSVAVKAGRPIKDMDIIADMVASLTRNAVIIADMATKVTASAHKAV